MFKLALRNVLAKKLRFIGTALSITPVSYTHLTLPTSDLV